MQSYASNNNSILYSLHRTPLDFLQNQRHTLQLLFNQFVLAALFTFIFRTNVVPYLTTNPNSILILVRCAPEITSKPHFSFCCKFYVTCSRVLEFTVWHGDAIFEPSKSLQCEYIIRVVLSSKWMKTRKSETGHDF